VAAEKKIVELGRPQQGMKRVIQNISENCQETSRRTVVCVARRLNVVNGEEVQELCAQSIVSDFMDSAFKSVNAVRACDMPQIEGVQCNLKMFIASILVNVTASVV
jgi:hypothetical protein